MSGQLQPLKHPFRLLIHGRSNSGKTLLLYNLLTRPVYYAEEFDEIHIWGGSVDLDNIMLSIIHCPLLKGRIKGVHREYDVAEFKEIVTDYEQRKINGEKVKAAFVFDDIGGQRIKGRAGQNPFAEFVLNIRHKELSLFFLVQMLSMGDEAILNSSDALAAYPKTNRDELYRMYRKFGDRTSDEFYELYDRATNEDYSFLFVNMQGPRTKYYKRFNKRLQWNDETPAPPPPPQKPPTQLKIKEIVQQESETESESESEENETDSETDSDS